MTSFTAGASPRAPRPRKAQAHGPEEIELFGNLPAEQHVELARAG